jgi:predicted PurR-regulated permease PerM
MRFSIFNKKILKWLLILSFITPIGIILPEFFKAQDAWGEWGTDTIKELVGYIPSGMEKLDGLWKAPFSDYAIKGFDKGIIKLSFSYIFSAIIGVCICIFLTFFALKLIKRNEKNV